MPYTQDNRSIAIGTPLGKDKLLLRALTINEQLGRPFVMRADLLSEDHWQRSYYPLAYA